MTAIIGWQWLQAAQPVTRSAVDLAAKLESFSPRIALHLDGLLADDDRRHHRRRRAGSRQLRVGLHREDANYQKFFAYTNLFIAMMLLLVLGDNLLLVYLGWEGVGLCSTS